MAIRIKGKEKQKKECEKIKTAKQERLDIEGAEETEQFLDSLMKELTCITYPNKTVCRVMEEGEELFWREELRKFVDRIYISWKKVAVVVTYPDRKNFPSFEKLTKALIGKGRLVPLEGFLGTGYLVYTFSMSGARISCVNSSHNGQLIFQFEDDAIAFTTQYNKCNEKKARLKRLSIEEKEIKVDKKENTCGKAWFPTQESKGVTVD